SGGTKAFTKAPLLPSYSSTWLRLPTKRLPLGPNTKPWGLVRPLPEAKTWTNLPALSYCSTWLLPPLLTKRSARAGPPASASSATERSGTARRGEIMDHSWSGWEREETRVYVFRAEEITRPA